MKKFLLVSLLLAAVQSVFADMLYWQITQKQDFEYSYAQLAFFETEGPGAAGSYLDKHIIDASISFAQDDGLVSGTPVDVKDFLELGGYFAVELINSEGGTVAVSTDRASYQDLLTQHAIEKGGLIPPQTAWFAPTTFAAPEPCSGVLILAGLALVGLRRRRM